MGNTGSAKETRRISLKDFDAAWPRERSHLSIHEATDVIAALYQLKKTKKLAHSLRREIEKHLQKQVAGDSEEVARASAVGVLVEGAPKQLHVSLSESLNIYGQEGHEQLRSESVGPKASKDQVLVYRVNSSKAKSEEEEKQQTEKEEEVGAVTVEEEGNVKKKDLGVKDPSYKHNLAGVKETSHQISLNHFLDAISVSPHVPLGYQNAGHSCVSLKRWEWAYKLHVKVRELDLDYENRKEKDKCHCLSITKDEWRQQQAGWCRVWSFDDIQFFDDGCSLRGCALSSVPEGVGYVDVDLRDLLDAPFPCDINRSIEDMYPLELGPFQAVFSSYETRYKWWRAINAIRKELRLAGGAYDWNLRETRGQFPSQTLFGVFEYFCADWEQLVNLSQVSVHWFKVSRNNLLWIRVFLEEFNPDETSDNVSADVKMLWKWKSQKYLNMREGFVKSLYLQLPSLEL